MGLSYVDRIEVIADRLSSTWVRPWGASWVDVQRLATTIAPSLVSQAPPHQAGARQPQPSSKKLHHDDSQIQHPRIAPTSLPNMRLTPLEKTLPDERLAEQEFDILLRPIPCRQRLQEHHDFLEIHSLEFLGPLDEEGGADVEVEGLEALLFGLEKGDISGIEGFLGGRGGFVRDKCPTSG